MGVPHYWQMKCASYLLMGWHTDRGSPFTPVPGHDERFLRGVPIPPVCKQCNYSHARPVPPTPIAGARLSSSALLPPEGVAFQ